jgi:hypothetical protein
MFTQTHACIFCFFLLCLTYCYPITNCQAQTTFGPQQIISTNAYGARDVYAIDLDGDGDNDVLSASWEDDKIAWYRNDGSGHFSSAQIISTTANGANSVYAIDLDDDGDNDVLSTSWISNETVWYINNGNGNFNTEQIISNNSKWSVYAIDLDGDGDNDVLSTGDDKISWYANDGGSSFSAGQIIGTNNNGTGMYTWSVYAIDLDGDGDNDVLSAPGDVDKIVWYRNDGSGNFSSEQIITTTASGSSVYAIDIDGDGDNDVISGSYGYINDGNGNFIISTTGGSYAIDIDNDGDNDVFPGLSLRINDGSGNFSSTQIISTNTDGALSVYAIDLDGDGDKDVLSASYDDNKIAWYKNQLYAVGVPNEPNNLAANATALTCTLINNTSTPNTLQIQYNAPQTQPSTLQLYNIMGSLVAQQTFDATKGINTWQIPVGAYPAGVYLLQVSNTNSKETIKWIKE